MKNVLTMWLFALLVLNLFLKLWGIWNVTSQDEYIEVIEALRVCSGHLNLERWMKRVYLYILAFEYGIYYVIQALLGHIDSTLDFATDIVRNMKPLFIIARATSALFSTMAIWLTFKLGQRIHSSLCGLIACIFLTFTPIVLEMSHYARVDATLSFLIVCGMFFIIRIYQDRPGRKSDFILAGLFSGLAFQCKIQGILLIVPFIVSYLFFRGSKGSFWKSILDKTIGFYLFGYIAGWIIGNPAVLFAFPQYLRSTFSMGVVYTQVINIVPAKQIGYISYFIDLFNQMGVFLFVLVLLSLAAAIAWRKTGEKIILISFIGVFYLVMGGSRYMVSPSYMLPIYPFLYLLGAMTLLDGSAVLISSHRIRSIIVTCLILILCLAPAVKAAKYILSISGPNTRVLAKNWIEENIPPHTRILMDSGKNLNTFAPLIAENKASLQRLIRATTEDINSDNVRKLSGLVSNQGLILYDLLLKTVPSVSYDITSTNRGQEVRELGFYRDQGFDYVIVSDDVASTFLSQEGRNMYPKSGAFYGAVKEELTLLKRISPGTFNSGDTFYIYSF